MTCKDTTSTSLTVVWGEPDTECPIQQYTGYYTGHILWSNNTINETLNLDQNPYVDLQGLTPWTFYTVCVAARIESDEVGFFSCCEDTTDESG